jgi:hypothetical protein
MFDRNKFMKAVNDLGAKVAKTTAKYVPAALSEDKRFSNAYAAALALLVCADLEVEADETIAAIGSMQYDFCLKDRGLVLSTLEYYGQFIGDLSKSFGVPTDYLLKKAQIIQEHIAVDLSPSCKNDIKNLCNALVGPSANRQERQVYNEIMSAMA